MGIEKQRTDRDLVLWAFPFFMDAANSAHLQMSRIQENDLESMDSAWPVQVLWYDWQTLITQLWRMRRIALLMGRANSIANEIKSFVQGFDEGIPKLKMCRDAIEHMDAYILADKKRHNKDVVVGGLMVGSVSNKTFSWAIHKYELEYNLDELMKTSWEFYNNIKALKNRVKAKPQSD